MENATKALLIAASVLIVIVLIAVGIKILGSTQGVTNSVDEVSNAMEISVFNSQFIDYEGTQTGAQVKALLNKAAATWRDGSLHRVTVNGCDSANEIADYRATININTTYKVTVGYDSKGYVNSITIEIPS